MSTSALRLQNIFLVPGSLDSCYRMLKFTAVFDMLLVVVRVLVFAFTVHDNWSLSIVFHSGHAYSYFMALFLSSVMDTWVVHLIRIYLYGTALADIAGFALQLFLAIDEPMGLYSGCAVLAIFLACTTIWYLVQIHILIPKLRKYLLGIHRIKQRAKNE